MAPIASRDGSGRCLAVLLCWAAASLAAAETAHAQAPTGDAQAIALNRQVQQGYSALPGVKVVQRGFLFARRLGRHDHDYLAGKKKGYRAATETAYLALSQGKVPAYLDQLRAPGVGRFSVLVNSSGVFRSELPAGGCWHRARRREAPFEGVGRSFVNLEGNHYLPLEHRGSLVISPLTYRSGSIKVTVVRTIDPHTHQFVSARWTYKTRKRTLKFTQRFTALSAPPTFPRPAPIC